MEIRIACITKSSVIIRIPSITSGSMVISILQRIDSSMAILNLYNQQHGGNYYYAYYWLLYCDLYSTHHPGADP